MSILIKNGTIITQNDNRDIVHEDILISEEGIVKEIEKNISERSAKVIDASKHIVMPGLVNTHTHVAMSIFRGYGEGLNLHDWLTKKIWPTEAKLTNEVVKAGTIMGIIEMLKSGTTAFNEMYVKGLRTMVDVSEKLNIRSVIARGMFDKGENSVENEINQTKTFINYVNDRIKDKNKHSGLVQPAVSCHAPYTASEELIVAGKKLATEKNLLFHIHVAETRKDVFDSLKKRGKRPVEFLYKIGVLDSKTVLAHASWVTKREIKYVGEKKAVVSHNPVSNLKLATGGIAPIKEYDTAGANVTLGTDGAASNNDLNMFESMKFASLLQKHKYWNANAIPAQRILDYSTINGGRALGVPGSIKRGEKADIIIIRKTPNMLPEHDIISNIVYASAPALIKWSIINGKISVENGKVPNEEQLIDDALCKINEFFNI